jgi:hypothetical protein
MGASTGEYVWVAIIGLLVGITELISRYRDNPSRALFNFPAFLYVLFNIVAAVLAMFLIRDVFHWNFNFEDLDANKTKIKVIGVLVSGLGAMAFFRSSLFVFRVGDKDVPLGPGIVLQVLLDVTDRAVDRSRAQPRAEIVSKIMQDVDFLSAKAALPAYCFALMQNVTAEEQTNFGRQVSQLELSTMSSPIKGLTLGLALMNLVGDAVLRAAVESLGIQIKQPPIPGVGGGAGAGGGPGVGGGAGAGGGPGVGGGAGAGAGGGPGVGGGAGGDGSEAEGNPRP